VGSGAVGKSAMTLQLINNRFVEGHDPTIEDSYQKYISIDEKPCRLDILDTAGQEEFKSMRPHQLRQGQGYLVVYSVTDATSFQKVREFYEQIVRSKGKEDNVIMCLCGNKSDLEDQRKVTKEEGEKMSETLKSLGSKVLFFETSAKSNKNVEECFFSLIRALRHKTVVPCSCKGKCNCNDKCKKCFQPRNTHDSDPTHKFMEKGGCIIM